MFKKLQCPAFLAILTMFALNAASDHATGQSSIRQSCTILASATVTGVVPMTMETLQPMHISGIAGNTGILYISPLSSPQAGLMRITANPGAKLMLHYLTGEYLMASDGIGSLFIRYEVSGYHERLQEASQPFYSGEAVFTTGSEGAYYLWLGGTLFFNEAIYGRYSGNFTIEIEYI